jgi:hypothetical protein
MFLRNTREREVSHFPQEYKVGVRMTFALQRVRFWFGRRLFRPLVQCFTRVQHWDLERKPQKLLLCHSLLAFLPSKECLQASYTRWSRMGVLNFHCHLLTSQIPSISIIYL